ncbi:phosphatidylserine decarboxylase [Suillus fuscotomentosus]|uniref:Phosphatidylserine decarboxylase n=1 Tax=Suillus fuscotomentosus TaxID=1912939 RepID=A0AAD4EES8_9AGAM|nr:phosphatidylserine decarboxylase [Suillus fuscotomentosus]KAG1904727.1 phosphatidylserine decarboxylase [Suillus fuscotomentosus]
MTSSTVLCGYGGWLPKHPAIYKAFIDHLVQRALRRSADSTLHEPAVAAFGEAIQGDPVMKSLFDQVFLQVDRRNQVTDFEHLLSFLDCIIVTAPKYEVAIDDNGNVIGEPIGVPIYLIFDLLSNTAAAYDLFRMKEFNRALKALLENWGKFLMEPGSNLTLNTTDQGWFGEAGITSLETHLGKYSFEQTYKCPDAAADNRGFTTWDAFFTRAFHDGVRPIVTIDNHPVTYPGGLHTRAVVEPTLIYSACESTVLRIRRDVKQHDQFWLKGQQYSLYNMLNRSDYYAKLFEGGTVYQAFLSPLDYHRWHSPIKGTVTDIVVVDGTYYAVLPDAGADKGDPDLPEGDPHGALIRSQPFLTIEAARVLIYIKSEDINIGTMCFVGVGMAEVSTCQVTVKKGQAVEPGTELGMFHFGGSSHALVFSKETEFHEGDEIKEGKHVWVNSVIGVATHKQNSE